LEFHCLTPLPGSEDHQKLYKAGVYMDPDLNNYDLEHATTAHATMSKEQFEQVYRDAWDVYYSPEHMQTVMRRAAASGISPGKVLFLLIWYYGCYALEKVHPLQGGYLRRKYRKDRRPPMPLENPFVFYARNVADLVYKHVKLAQAIWRYGRFRQQLRHNPDARNYTDLAMTPVTTDDFDAFELFTITDAAKSEVTKARTPTTGAATVATR
jgi:hypothetical protein